MIILVDIDHTLTDAAWRDVYLGEWDIYHPLSIQDRPVIPVIRAVNALALLGWRVILFTSRNERWRSITMQWLVENLVLADELIMRPEDDFRPCGECKFELAKSYLGDDLEGVTMVWDNKEDVLEPFRRLGIPTMLVDIGVNGLLDFKGEENG